VGRIGQIVEVLDGGRSVKVDLGSGQVVTAQWSTLPGDDTRPIVNDSVYLGALPGSGRWVVLGGIDPKDTRDAGAGERRMYARDSGGDLVAAVWVKSDGSVIITTGAGDHEFNADGSVDFANGASITAAGDVLTKLGISLQTHTHLSSSPGNPSGPPM
jgi:hypothetical protein